MGVGFISKTLASHRAFPDANLPEHALSGVVMGEPRFRNMVLGEKMGGTLYVPMAGMVR